MQVAVVVVVDWPVELQAQVSLDYLKLFKFIGQTHASPPGEFQASVLFSRQSRPINLIDVNQTDHLNFIRLPFVVNVGSFCRPRSLRSPRRPHEACLSVCFPLGRQSNQVKSNVNRTSQVVAIVDSQPVRCVLLFAPPDDAARAFKSAGTQTDDDEHRPSALQSL